MKTIRLMSTFLKLNQAIRLIGFELLDLLLIIELYFNLVNSIHECWEEKYRISLRYFLRVDRLYDYKKNMIMVFARFRYCSFRLYRIINFYFD